MNVTTNNFIHRIVMTRFAGFLGAFILLPACDGAQKDESGDSNDESAPSVSLMTDTAGTSGGTSSESGDTGSSPMNMCPPNPFFRCTVAYDCENKSGTDGKTLWVCGALKSPLDVHGCLRSRCKNHQECAAGEKCFNDHQCNVGGCSRSGMDCSDERGGVLDGICECSGADDCSSEQGWCVPEAIYECPLEESTGTSTTSDATDSSSGGGTEFGTCSESTN